MAGFLAATLLTSPLPTAAVEEVSLGTYAYVPARTAIASQTARLSVRGLALTQESDEPVAIDALAGAEFGVYVKDAQGQMRPWANPLYPQEPMRVRSGEEAVSFALPAGQQFFIHQESAPSGYRPMDEEYLPVEAGAALEIVNAMPGEVQVKVTDTAGAALAGARLRLTAPDGAVLEGETDSQGLLTFEGLTEGLYAVEETEAPQGAAALDQTVQMASIADASRVRVSFVHPQKGRLSLSAVTREALEDGSVQEAPLSGLTLTIAGPEGTVQVETDDEGRVVCALSAGTYRVTVEDELAGYVLAERAFEAVVADEQETRVELTALASGGRAVIELEADGGVGASVTLVGEEQTYGPYDVEAGRNVTEPVPAGAYSIAVSEAEDGWLPADEVAVNGERMPLSQAQVTIKDAAAAEIRLRLLPVYTQTFTLVGTQVQPDGQETRTQLPDIQLSVLDAEGTPVVDAATGAPMTLTTDGRARLTLTLPQGDYILYPDDGQEVIAAYATGGLAVSLPTEADTLSLPAARTRIVVSALSEQDARLSGAVYALTDAAGNRTELAVDENGRAVSEPLAQGDYVLSCVKAPGGYASCGDVQVSVRPGPAVQARMVHKELGGLSVQVLRTELDAAGEEVSAPVPGVSLSLYALKAGGDAGKAGDFLPYPTEAPVTYTADAQGAISLRLPAGTYRLALKDETLISCAEASGCALTFTVVDGERREEALRIGVGNGGVEAALEGDWTAEQIAQTAYVLVADANGDGIPDEDAPEIELSAAGAGLYRAKDVAPGAYVLRQTLAPEGYGRADEIPVSVPAGHILRLDLRMEENARLSVTKTGITFNSELQMFSVPLGAAYAVYTRTAQGDYLPYPDAQAQAVIYANATASQIEAGARTALSLPARAEGSAYYLLEVEGSSSEGYLADRGYHEVVVYPGQSQTATITSTADRGFFRVELADMATGAPLTGGEFELYALAEGGYDVQPEQQPVLSFASEAGAYTSAMALPVGEYLLVQTAAPDGYMLDPRVSDTRIPLEIPSYVATGDSVAAVRVQNAAAIGGTLGGELEVQLESGDGRARFALRNLAQGDNPVPVEGAGALIYGTEALDIETVRILQAKSADGRALGARLVYQLEEGGWQWTDVRTADLSQGDALVSLADVAGGVSAVRVVYVDLGTGAEEVPAGFVAPGIDVEAALVCAQDAQIQMNAQRTGVYTYADARGENVREGSLEAQAHSDLVTGCATGESAARAQSAWQEAAGTVAGTLFDDADGDGWMRPQGQHGLQGARVTLLSEDGQVLFETLTDAQGAYRFDGVAPGTYRVQALLPEGWRFTQEKGGLGGGARVDEQGRSEAFAIDAQQAFACVNLGALLGAAVRGVAFADENADGARDGSETALSGVRVSLIGQSGLEIAHTTTDETGAFYLDDLFPGRYSLRFDAPDGYAAVGGADVTASGDASLSTTGEMALEAGEVSRELAAGFLRVGEISGSAFIDENADGLRDAVDRGLAGVTVKLIRDVDGQSVEAAAALTDEAGAYRFERVRAGKYRVLFELPDGYVFSQYAPDAEDGSDVYGAVTSSGMTQPFLLTTGEKHERLDAGATLPASMTVVCWQDTQYDGVMSSTEGGLSGVRLSLSRLEAGTLAQTLALETDENGRAVFEAVSPGTYVLTYTLPDAWRTTKNVQREGAVVSGVPMSALPTGETEPFTLGMGQQDAAIYIGAMISSSIRGAVFADADDNGLWDAGESALEGVLVELLDADGLAVATVTSGAEGAYAFEGLAPGRYRVRFTADECAFSGTSRTQARGCAPRTEEDSSTTDLLNVTMGGSLAEINAGVVALSTVSGRIFEDSDGDGAQGAFERMLPDVQVELLYADTNRVARETVTVSDGAFVFGGVRPGSYRLRLTLPDGYVYAAAAGLESAEMEKGTTGVIQVRYGEDVEDLTWGALVMGGVTGLVWDDEDFDGALTEGEGAVRGAVVELLNAAGDAVQTVTTLRKGEFAFENLMPGVYSLRLTLPDGYVLTRAGDSAVAAEGARAAQTVGFDLAMGERRTDVRFGALRPAAIEGTTWIDADDDGRPAGGESAMPGVEVSLFSEESGACVAQTRTDETGAWRFTDVMPGDYRLHAALPDGYAFARRAENGRNTSAILTTDASEGQSEAFALRSGRTAQMQIGAVGVGSIGGAVWLDSQYDGLMSTDEAGIADAQAELLDEAGALVMQTRTDEHGRYAFERVRMGNYSVRIRLPGGEIFTKTPEDGDSLIPQQDTDVGETATMKLEMGAVMTGVNAGAIEPGSIEGSTFIDRNEDGQLSQGEEALGGVLVELMQGGTVVASQTTDELGAFAFETLRPGNYRLRIALPAGYLFGREVSLNLAHEDDAQGESPEMLLDMGCSIDGLNYPALPGASISGCAWEDLDVGGVRDAGEPALAGTKADLMLKMDGGWQVLKAVTIDESGTYAFERLRPGTYAVRFTLPGNYLFTENATYAPEQNSDVFVVPGQTGTTPEMTLAMGDAQRHVDVGGILPGRLGDTVWLDENGNGLQDHGEPFVEGVTLELYAVLADGSKTLAQTAVSDAYGRYRMKELRPGRYVLRAILPEGRTFTQRVEGLPEIDSDIADVQEGYGETEVFVLRSGQTLLSVDVGLQ